MFSENKVRAILLYTYCNGITYIQVYYIILRHNIVLYRYDILKIIHKPNDKRIIPQIIPIIIYIIF
jgi:hypothetical protein